MAILVTGGCGYIGGHLVHALVDSGFRQIVVLDNMSTGNADFLPADIHIVEADVADRIALRTIFARYGIDTVFHLAASLIVSESIVNPGRYYEENSVKTLVLLQEAAEFGITKFIFSSTAAVYGPSDSKSIKECARLDPPSAYGASKMFVEYMLRDFSIAHGIRHAILRYFNVAGADPNLRYGQKGLLVSNLIDTAVRSVRTGNPIEIFGNDYPTKDGTCIRDFIHVSDLVSCHIYALNSLEDQTNVILNCGYGKGHSVMEVISMVERVAGVKLVTVAGKRRVGDLPEVVSSASHIRQLGWLPKFDELEIMVSTAYNWANKYH